MPLETLVEADDVHAAPTARMRVRAGQHFERLLAARDVGQYAGRLPHRVPDRGGAAARPTPPAGASWRSSPAARSTARSSTATSRRRCARTPPALPAAPAIAAADAAAVRAAAQAWVAWADALVFTPSGGPAGVGARAARVRVRARPRPDGVTLEADEYTDGHLDWHTFTRHGHAGHPRRPAAPRSGPLTVVPDRGHLPGHARLAAVGVRGRARRTSARVEAQPEDLGPHAARRVRARLRRELAARPARGPGRHARPDHPPRRARHVRAHDHRRPDRARRRVGHVRPLARGRPARRRAARSRPRSPRACRAATSRRCSCCATRPRTSPGRSSARSRARTAGPPTARRPRTKPPRRPRPPAARPTRCPTACAPTRRRTGSRCCPSARSPPTRR